MDLLGVGRKALPVAQRRVSPHTVASYRDTFRLLFPRFAEERTGKAPSQLGLADLDVGLIGAFLDHLTPNG